MQKRITKALALLMVSAMVLTGCGGDKAAEETKPQESAVEETSGTAAEKETVETEKETVEMETGTAEAETETEAETAEAETETETETVEQKPEYTYSDLSETMFAKSAVNVRDLPGTDGNRVGGLNFAQEVNVTGQRNETGWYRINYDNKDAYVSNSYIVKDKPEPKPEEVAQQPASGGHWYDDYEPYKWYDMDTYFFIIVKSEDQANYTFNEGKKYQSILAERYPDRTAYLGGAGPHINDEYAIAEVCACHKTYLPEQDRYIPAWDVDLLWAH